MQVDEILALMERNFINVEKEKPVEKSRYAKNMKAEIQKQGFIDIRGIIFDFDEKQYFDEKIPMIQIKYNYKDINKEDNHIYLYQEQFSITQRFWLYQGDSDNINDWLVKLEHKCSEQNWKMIIEKARNINQLYYCCYGLNTNANEFYNIIFQINIAGYKIRGIFHCFYKDKNDFGILLEALLLLSYEKIVGHFGGE